MEPQTSEVSQGLPTEKKLIRDKRFYGLVAIMVGVILFILLFLIISLAGRNNTNTNQVQQNNVNTTNNNVTVNNDNDTDAESSQETSSDANPDLLPIKHLGIEISNFDESTMRAGDIVFSENKLGEYDMPYFDYGFRVKDSSAAPARSNPQPTFIVAKGTKVRSIVDGVVIAVSKLYSNDYSIQVASRMESQYIYELEHVINPQVKVGDSVTAGQIVAEASEYDAHNYDGNALVEIGILVGGNPPSHICPFQYLDPSIKSSTEAKLKQLYSDWNEFRGEEVYDVNLTIPGCITTDPVEG